MVTQIILFIVQSIQIRLPQTVLLPFSCGHTSLGLTRTSWHPAPFYPSPSLSITYPWPSLPILALSPSLPIACPSPFLPFSLFVLTHNSLGAWMAFRRLPCGSVGQPGMPNLCPQSLDLEFYSLANLPSLPACNLKDGG